MLSAHASLPPGSQGKHPEIREHKAGDCSWKIWFMSQIPQSTQTRASCSETQNLWSSAVHDENQAPEKGNPKIPAREAESCLELVLGKDWAEGYMWISATFLMPKKEWLRRHLHPLIILSQEPQTLSWGCSWRTWTGFPLNFRQKRRRKRTPV